MKTLVVAPHPDDEILGCGGTLLRRQAEGRVLGWLIMTSMSEQSGWVKARIEQREQEIVRVRESIGFAEVFNLRLTPAHLDQIPKSELISRVSEVFKAFEPEEVLIPHRRDAHSDHCATFDAVSACCKWFRYPSVRRVLSYETPSETEFGLGADAAFHPNTFVDISRHIDRKVEIMQIYRSEMGDFPFPRSVEAIRALASVRGATAGFRAAEAFQLLRERL